MRLGTHAPIRLVSVLVGLCLFAQDAPVLNEAIKPLYFETLNYPLKARLNRVQGTVVVRLSLDTDGRVASSTAISGAKELISDCLSNAKKWRFRPNAENAAVIIYRFKIQGLCNLPCSSHFRVEPPNFVTVTIGDPVLNHSGN